MPAKKITPATSAAEQIEQLKNNPRFDEAAAELARMRSEAAKLSGAIPTHDLPGPAPQQEQRDVALPDMPLLETVDSVVIKIHDGREIEMGPPTIPHMLAVAEIFKEYAVTDSVQLEAKMRMAKIFQYIRRINGQRLPGFIANWQDITKLAHELGDFGCRAVYECYQLNWPDFNQTSWQVVRKSVSNQNFSKSSA